MKTPLFATLAPAICLAATLTACFDSNDNTPTSGPGTTDDDGTTPRQPVPLPAPTAITLEVENDTNKLTGVLTFADYATAKKVYDAIDEGKTQYSATLALQGEAAPISCMATLSENENEVVAGSNLPKTVCYTITPKTLYAQLTATQKAKPLTISSITLLGYQHPLAMNNLLAKLDDPTLLQGVAVEATNNAENPLKVTLTYNQVPNPKPSNVVMKFDWLKSKPDNNYPLPDDDDEKIATQHTFTALGAGNDDKTYTATVSKKELLTTRTTNDDLDQNSVITHITILGKQIAVKKIKASQQYITVADDGAVAFVADGN